MPQHLLRDQLEKNSSNFNFKFNLKISFEKWPILKGTTFWGTFDEKLLGPSVFFPT
jgi:hypothetical protein